MNKKDRILFILFVIIVQIIQFTIVLLISNFNNSLIEFIIIFLVFHINRHIFGKTYHSDKLSICTMVSVVLFYFLTAGVFPLQISIFSAPIIGIYLSFVLNLTKELIDNQTLPKPFKRKQIREQIIDIVGVNVEEEQIENFCKSKNMNLKIAETVYLYLSNSKDEVADILEIDGATVIRRCKKFIEKATE